MNLEPGRAVGGGWQFSVLNVLNSVSRLLT
jgi:hypothetical protein